MPSQISSRVSGVQVLRRPPGWRAGGGGADGEAGWAGEGEGVVVGVFTVAVGLGATGGSIA